MVSPGLTRIVPSGIGLSLPLSSFGASATVLRNALNVPEWMPVGVPSSVTPALPVSIAVSVVSAPEVRHQGRHREDGPERDRPPSQAEREEVVGQGLEEGPLAGADEVRRRALAEGDDAHRDRVVEGDQPPPALQLPEELGRGQLLAADDVHGLLIARRAPLP